MKVNEQGMTLIVKTVTRLTAGLILVYGIYITLHNNTGPGGGFAGGVIITLAFVHLMLAFGKEAVLKKINLSKCVSLAGLGAMIFLFTIILKAAPYHVNLASLGDSAIALAVATGLFAMFLALVLLIVGNGEK